MAEISLALTLEPAPLIVLFSGKTEFTMLITYQSIRKFKGFWVQSQRSCWAREGLVRISLNGCFALASQKVRQAAALLHLSQWMHISKAYQKWRHLSPVFMK